MEVLAYLIPISLFLGGIGLVLGPVGLMLEHRKRADVISIEQDGRDLYGFDSVVTRAFVSLFY